MNPIFAQSTHIVYNSRWQYEADQFWMEFATNHYEAILVCLGVMVALVVFAVVWDKKKKRW